MEEYERELAVIDAALDQGFLDEAYDMLWDHYGKKLYQGKKYRNRKDNKEFEKDCSKLWMAVQPTDGQLFLEAVKKHVIDHNTMQEGQNAGDWMPTAANLARHIVTASEERSALQSMKQEEEKKSLRVPIEEAKSGIIKITNPLLRQAFGKDFIECIPNKASRCETCGDTGRIPFYYIPDKPRHVFLQHEWFDLSQRSPEKAELFEISTCVCDECEVGINLWDKFSLNNPAYRPSAYWTIKRLAEKRKERGVQKIKKQEESAQQKLF